MLVFPLWDYKLPSDIIFLLYKLNSLSMFHNKLKTQTCYEFKYVRSPASQNCNVESSFYSKPT